MVAVLKLLDTEQRRGQGEGPSLGLCPHKGGRTVANEAGKSQHSVAGTRQPAPRIGGLLSASSLGTLSCISQQLDIKSIKLAVFKAMTNLGFFQKNHRITKSFGLEGTLKIIYSNHPAMGRDIFH
ncbi:hypothetical protein QYF61_015904 [Mycteria americana]|uniref:Uncharacterized protein n=1 Tax=Mycteria americana TaxID=33587 RepID=A0AAN7SAH5_MYCAM|nr:hypothetical protein QYF61_015904 [Mycteria americana]